MPILRHAGREGLSALPQLPAQAQGSLPRLRAAARGGLEDLPVLRVGGRRRPDRPPGAPSPRPRGRAGGSACRRPIGDATASCPLEQAVKRSPTARRGATAPIRTAADLASVAASLDSRFL